MNKSNFALVRMGLFIAGVLILFLVVRKLGKEVTIDEEQ